MAFLAYLPRGDCKARASVSSRALRRARHGSGAAQLFRTGSCVDSHCRHDLGFTPLNTTGYTGQAVDFFGETKITIDDGVP